MTKTTPEIQKPLGNKTLILSIALALIVISAVLCLVNGLHFNTEFGGGSAMTVTFPDNATQVQLDKAVKALESATGAKVYSAQLYSTDSVLVKAQPLSDPTAAQKAVATALGVNADNVSVANTQRYVDKDSLISVALSLAIAGAIVLIYTVLRFGWVATLSVVLGMVGTVALWLVPYSLCIPFDYKAFTVLAVGLALMVVEAYAVFGRRLKKAADRNSRQVQGPVYLVTGLGLVAALALGIASNAWSISLPLIATLLGAGFFALWVNDAFICLCKK